MLKIVQMNRDVAQYSQDDADDETKDAKVGTTTMRYPFKGDLTHDLRNINGDVIIPNIMKNAFKDQLKI